MAIAQISSRLKDLESETGALQNRANVVTGIVNALAGLPLSQELSDDVTQLQKDSAESTTQLGRVAKDATRVRKALTAANQEQAQADLDRFTKDMAPLRDTVARLEEDAQRLRDDIVQEMIVPLQQGAVADVLAADVLMHNNKAPEAALRAGIAGAKALVADANKSPLGTAQQPITVRHTRALESETPTSQSLWSRIRRTSLTWDRYASFINNVVCGDWTGRKHKDIQHVKEARDPIAQRLRLPFPGVEPYRQLKVATEVFMSVNCGVDTLNFDDEAFLRDEEIRWGRKVSSDQLANYWKDLLNEGEEKYPELGFPALPYLAIIARRLDLRESDIPISATKSILQGGEEDAVLCEGFLRQKLTGPCFIELIWSYWHEEGMLVQTMNAISWRFQNRRGPAERDPLAAVEIDPLRPLNNFLWGYIQDEQHRLTLPRRAYEYDHHYGLKLRGKAVPGIGGADSRSRFLEAFHHLLFVCSIFFKEDDDTTVVADGFPILNALREVHLLLTQGAHNQYGDLPWTARQEMLMQEWLLARPEFREFLPRRIMVDYTEDWMDSVETMKNLQGWTDSSIMHFRDLGVFGEQILLGIRFNAWPGVIQPVEAANWARYWRAEIQGYLHAYRAVTGVDLTEGAQATLPSILLERRLSQQRVRTSR